jgi:hypothetical protein
MGIICVFDTLIPVSVLQLVPGNRLCFIPSVSVFDFLFLRFAEIPLEECTWLSRVHIFADMHS